MADYNFNTSGTNVNRVSTNEGQRSLLARSFLYMLGFLFLTAVVTAVLGFVWTRYLSTDNVNVYNGLMIGSSIGVLVLSIIISFTSIRGGKASVIPMVIYSLLMGVMLSSFSIFLEWYVLAATFGIAALAFGAMALLGIVAKNLSGLGLIGSGLLFGVLLVSLFNVFMFFFLPSGTWTTMNIIISAVIVLAVLLITAYDVWRIKTISARCIEGGNLALYFAFSLYLDFVLILMQLLRLVALFAGRR